VGRLLGEPIALTELSPKELSLEPIRADAIILQQSKDLILHIEFQTQPDDDIPFRMLGYRVRGHRKFPKKRMLQIVIYLQKTNSAKVQQTTFSLEDTFHRFQVVRLWEQPTEIFLQTPGLLPLAVLSNTSNPTNTLQQVATAINAITDKRMQSNIASSTFILAGLVLKKEVVQRLLRRDIMRESVTYQLLVEEVREEFQERICLCAVSMLKEGLSLEIIAKVTGLTLEQVQQLQIRAIENQENTHI